MLFHTEINIQPLEQTIAYGDGLLFLGSCFADEVGNICKGLGFNALVNPFGVLYNPISIAQSMERLNNGKPFTHENVISVGKNQYCTFSHNTAFWNVSETALLEQTNASLETAHEHFMKSKWIVVSLGTSWVFKHKETGSIVSNCHKLPAQQFERIQMTPFATRMELMRMIKAHPDKQFIFTVSPLRHLKDGLHGNQISKAALLIAADQVCSSRQNAHYFPAYEIMMDELRDYRFYKEDMVHPTEQAVHYIWERFVNFAIDPAEKPAMKMALEVKQMLHHHPLFPESEEFKKFQLRKSEKTAELGQRYPNVIIENL